ncbi:MAG TPA: PPOX class F420-dependent oxidoreductase [Chloroflexia bacterium]|nr:PPOX class F420-dependent oxidoreductase [Chloroflexia bacterium]
MSVFTPAEIEYLSSQRLCRLATIGRRGEPHVVPVRFSYNAGLDVIELGGGDFGTSKKFRDMLGNPAVALVVDDLTPPPVRPRGVEVRGRAEALLTGGDSVWPGADPEYVRVTPTYIASWGIDGDPYSPAGRAAHPVSPAPTQTEEGAP